MHTAEINWVSNDPHLSGNSRDRAGAECRRPTGHLGTHSGGAERGLYANGPNPLFKPLSFTYPLDGDGMVHAVYRTTAGRAIAAASSRPALRAEQRAGRALYGGVMRPIPVDPALASPEGDPGPFKNGAFIRVSAMAGTFLAVRGNAADEMTRSSRRSARRAGTDSPIELGAHNRRHPRSGELFALTYAVDQPLIRFHRIDASGNLVNTFPVVLAKPTMIHDFVLTERHIVLLACPAIFDMQAAEAGQSMLQWQPSLGTRIAVIALDGGSVVWLDADPFFVSISPTVSSRAAASSSTMCATAG